MSKVAIQRVLPYALKRTAGFDYPADLDNISYINMDGDFPEKSGPNSDIIFDEKVRTLGLSATNRKNTFSFVHLDCAHQINWVKPVSNVFSTLNEYFSQMKALGIFENSTIILSADHGAARDLKRPDFDTSALFIKEKGVGGGELKINNTAKLSNGFFLSSIFELIGAEDKKPNASYYDVIYREMTPDRYYYTTYWTDVNYAIFEKVEKLP